MVTASVASPRKTDKSEANIRISIIGLLNCERRREIASERLLTLNRLGPKLIIRSLASSLAKPYGVVLSSSTSLVAGMLQSSFLCLFNDYPISVILRMFSKFINSRMFIKDGRIIEHCGYVSFALILQSSYTSLGIIVRAHSMRVGTITMSSMCPITGMKSGIISTGKSA